MEPGGQPRRSRVPRAGRGHRWELLWLLACLAAGAALRAWRLGDRSLWTDELITLVTLRRPLGESLTQLQDYAAPAYQILLRLVARGEAPPEWLLRAPACAFGVASIAAAWWLGRTLFGRRAAALAAVLVAVNPQQIYFAREARPYTLLVLASALSMTFLWRLARGGRRGDLAGYAAATALMVWSHYLGFLVLAAQGAWVALGAVLTRRWPRGALLAGLGMAATAGLPAAWLASRFLTSGARGLEGWVPERGFLDAFLLLGEALGARPLGVLCAIPLLAALWVPASAFDHGASDEGGIAAETAPARWWRRRQAALLCALWVAASLFAVAAVSQLYRPMLIPRYVLAAALPMILLAVAYLLRVSRGALAIALAVALWGSLAAGSTNLRDLLAPEERGLRELARWLADDADPRAALLVVDWPFVDGFVNPEIEGLAYYGVPRERIGRLTVRYPAPLEVIDNGALPTRQRAYLLGLNVTRPAIDPFLTATGRPWATGPVGENLLLYQVEPPTLP